MKKLKQSRRFVGHSFALAVMTNDLSMHKLYQPFLRIVFTAALSLSSFVTHSLLAQQALRGVVRIKVSETLATRLEQSAISKNVSGNVITGVQSLDRLNSQLGVRQLTRVFPPAGKHEARHRKHGLHLWYEVRMDKSIPVSSALQSYQSDNQILRAEAVYQKTIIGASSKDFGARVIDTETFAALPNAPNDPLLSRQWHYNNTGQTGGTAGADISLFDAWKIETGKPSVIIAVTDGGIQVNHPDLAPNMWVNTGEIPGNKLDDDNNGYIDDIHGYSFVNDSGIITAHDHGTHVAGTIAAVNNNGTGVAGIAGGSGASDGVKLMSCAVFTADSIPDGFAEAYVYSADNGAVISQNSWGYNIPGVFEQVVLDAIDYFIAEAGKDDSGRQTGPMNGGLAIFSAGNFNDQANYYPAFYEPVIAVASTTHRDLRAYYSNYGSWVDISAPGGETDVNEAQGVVSTLPGNQYGAFMGTSMACPHVAGVAALIVSKFGKAGLQPEAVKKRLLLSVDDISSLNPAYQGKLGSGRINAARALNPGDGQPPRPINDLAVVNVDVGEMTLAWTSPRDEGDFAAEYELRYSATGITANNFNTATRVQNVPTPAAAGKRETFTVKNLPDGTLLYFAIRSRDFEGNTSSISNIVSQKSALAPSASTTPSSLQVNLKTAQKASHTIVLNNSGKGVLKFRVEPFAGTNIFTSTTVVEGEVAAGGQTPIAVSFDASEKAAGVYRSNLIITTNDPQHRTITVPLTLQVTNNGAPIASLSEKAVDFKSVQVGMVAHRKIAVYNAGSEPLVIEKISSNNPAYRVDGVFPLTIASFQRKDVQIAFSPSSIGRTNAALTFFTNDPQDRQLTLQAQGEGTKETPIALSPDSFSETLERGTTAIRKLSMRNNGSQDRHYRLSVTNHGLAIRGDESSANGRMKGSVQNAPDPAYLRKLKDHQARLAERDDKDVALLKPLTPGNEARSRKNATGRISQDETPAYTRDLRQYTTGFEEFATADLGEQNGWFSTDGWTISDQNPSAGAKHFRGTSHISGTGEKYAISPYLFEYEEFYYPQYTSFHLRMNLDKAKGTTWQVVPQDPWSYVATRIRFNADGTIDALVIDNNYESHWRRVPAEIPAGYFDLALEYNNAGSDTSGFPTYLLFINKQHVFSGTGLAPGVGQLAFVSPMEGAGPVLDADELQITGGEYIPDFIHVQPAEGTVRAGQSVSFDVAFDATLIKYGTYESDIVVHLDDADSLVVPATLIVPGAPSLTSDIYSIYWVLEKSEVGLRELTLTNDGGQIVEFKMTTDMPGLSLNPASGVLDVRQAEVVEVRQEGPPGIFNGEIMVSATGGIDAKKIPVNIIRMDSGAVFHAPEEVTFSIPAGEIATRTFQIRNDGINTVSFTTTIRDFDSTIQVNPPAGMLVDDPLTLTLTIDARDLQPGMRNSAIRFTTNDPARRLVETLINLNITGDQPECAGAGHITREQWNGIQGNLISSIPVDRAPSSIENLTLFESPSDIRDNYGARLRGFLCVPQSGKYTFWIASNDHSELWLSTNANPANKKQIAYVTGYTNPRQWTKFPSQQSAPVYLESGKRYYIEALHKEGIGTDHLAVGWQMPDGILERPIPGMRLIPYEETADKCIASGTITREWWTGIQGNLVSSIPLGNTPQGVESLTAFEGPVNIGINYGARISGFICPPETGEYSFWIASNDHSELWLSSDGDPANKTKIAFITGATNVREWDKFRSQKSVPILLIRGRTYYIEALHKQGIGTDHVAVGWQLPNGTLERPVPGSRLSPMHVVPQQFAADSESANLMQEMSVQVFPNPLKGEKLNIIVNNISANAEPGEVFIHELTGLPVYRGKLSCESGCETEIDISGKFKPGIYLLLIKQGTHTITEKLIVP